MRQVVLDTETTGLTVDDGHRIIEIGCLEIFNRRSTGEHFHCYLNPERKVDEGAIAIHGLTDERLRDEPRFAEIAERFLAFVSGAQVLIHNASFDVGFLDMELRRLGKPPFGEHIAGVIDTLGLARELHPGRRNSLDVLCERYGISNAHRKLHGALLDAELLADVYLAMTRGQDSLEIGVGQGAGDRSIGGQDGEAWPPAGLRVIEADEAALQAHRQLLDGIAKEARGPALWDRAGQ